MIAIQIARIIADIMIFLNLTDDDTVDPDAAVQMLEALGDDLEGLDKGFLRELVDAFQAIAPEYSGEAQKLVRNIARDMYLEEALAADNPVRLAELEALRDAEEIDTVDISKSGGWRVALRKGGGSAVTG